MPFNDIGREFSSDLSLWNKFLEGDNDAYSEIYTLYVQRLYRYGALYTTDKDLIKDCIQDIFVKIYNNRTRLGQIDNVFSYLSVALKNTILNALKKKYGKVEYTDFVDSIDVEENVTPETYYIDNEDENQKNRTIDFIMSKLTIRQREIIFYRFIEEMNIDEISRITNMNNQSVSNIIQRSLARIRFFFKKD